MKIIERATGHVLAEIMTNRSMTLDEALDQTANITLEDMYSDAEYRFGDDPTTYHYDELDLVSDDWEEGEL